MQRIASALVVTVSLVVSACNADTTSQGPIDDGLRAQALEVESRLWSMWTPRDAATINNAHGRVVSECMQAAGFNFQALIVTESQQAELMARAMRPTQLWLFDDPAAASVNGYEAIFEDVPNSDPAPQREQTGPASVIESMSANEQDRYWLTFFGRDDERIEIVELDGGTTSVAGGGCMGQADRAIYGDDIATKLRLEDAWSTAITEFVFRVEAERSVSAVVRQWRRCMAGYGYRPDSPSEALEMSYDLPANLATDMAVADTMCKQETGVARAYAGAVVEVGTEAISLYEDQLIAFAELQQTALNRSRDILGLDG